MARTDPASVAMGRAIRGAIVSAGLSNEKTADKLGVGVNTLSRRINGSLSFTWSEVVRIAELTGTTATEIAKNAERIAGNFPEQEPAA